MVDEDEERTQPNLCKSVLKVPKVGGTGVSALLADMTPHRVT